MWTQGRPIANQYRLSGITVNNTKISFGATTGALLLAISVLSTVSALDVSGEWNTDYSRMTIRQSGDYIEGKYTASDNGEIFGKLDGNRFDGFWIEDKSSEKCTEALRGRYYWGKLQIDFTSDRFIGRWNYCKNTILNKSWNGSRPDDDRLPPAGLTGTW